MSIFHGGKVRYFVFTLAALFACTTVSAKTTGYGLDYQDHFFQRCSNLTLIEYNEEDVTILKPGDLLYIGDRSSYSAPEVVFSTYFKYVGIVSPYFSLQTPYQEPFNVKFVFCKIEKNNPSAQMICYQGPTDSIYLTNDFSGSYPEYLYSNYGWSDNIMLGFCGVSGNTLFVKVAHLLTPYQKNTNKQSTFSINR